MTDCVERWLPIEGWPGYEVSDWGHVRSFWGPGSGKKGQRVIGAQPKLIGFKLGSGHRSVLLYRNQSTEKRRAPIHTLVLEAFVGPRPDGMEACHGDGDPANNRLANLRWDTRSSNERDRLKHGTHPLAILSEGDIPKVWEMIQAGVSDTVIGKRFGVSATTICHIRVGDTWRHITKELSGDWVLTETQNASGEPIHAPQEFCGIEEVWRAIPGWPPYRVSNHGRIQSCLEKAKGKGVGRGVMLLTDNWKDRASVADKDGYRIFWARRNGENPTMLKVHACVLLAFAGPAPTGFVACHINGDRADNRAENLRWDTSKRNVADRFRHRKEKAHS